MKSRIIAAAAAVITVASACSRLSDEAREIVGDYYISEISDDEPVMELRDDGSCVMHAIKPGVLTYTVTGEWNVLNDSLLVKLDPETLEWEGDSTLIGDIPATLDKKVVRHSDLSLELEHEGISYVYHRRNK